MFCDVFMWIHKSFGGVTIVKVTSVFNASPECIAFGIAYVNDFCSFAIQGLVSERTLLDDVNCATPIAGTLICP